MMSAWVKKGGQLKNIQRVKLKETSDLVPDYKLHQGALCAFPAPPTPRPALTAISRATVVGFSKYVLTE